jgi:hypothetical protein
MSYAIVVTDSLTGKKQDLCRVGTNPETIALAAGAIPGGGTAATPVLRSSRLATERKSPNDLRQHQ